MKDADGYSVSNRVEAIVIGGGVIGLAVARALALRGVEVVVLERETRIGTGASSRNSEVIHAGLYYAPGSLKARLCVEGQRLLYPYCEARGVEHRRTGKVVVATGESEVPRLREIHDTARSNGAVVEWLDVLGVRAIETEVHCVAGVWSPNTGILDSHGLMLALMADLEAHGGLVSCGSGVTHVERRGGGFRVVVEPAGDVVECGRLVIAAGLQAQELARRIEGYPAGQVPSQRLTKGHYFVLTGRSPFQHLVYPLPAGGGLGIHVTLDLQGRARFGPDTVPIPTVDFGFDESVRPAFEEAIRRYYPAIDGSRLSAGYTGVRSQLEARPGMPADFAIHGRRDHGIDGLVALFGIESPGLTAALAIGEYVADLIQ